MTSFFSSPRCQFCCCCCQHKYSLCHCCGNCFECCSCPPPPMPCLPQLPQAPQCQYPVRIIREQILVPCPYPVYPRPRTPNECEYETDVCNSPCDYTYSYGTRTRIKKCSEDYHLGTPCYPRSTRCPEKLTCLPWPRPKRIHMIGQSVMPGYRGHVPGLKFHAAGRSFGRATRDTRCIMSQWDECCPRLPSRIWEQ